MEPFPQAAWDLLRSSVPKNLPAQSPKPSRKLQSDELRNLRNKQNKWNEDIVSQFLSNQEVDTVSIDLPHGRTLILSIEQDKQFRIPEIANECSNLLTWLGAPSDFTVYLWWIDAPRRIRADEWPSRRTVNGGWTTPGTNEIFIYREEEWDRVLLHETIHALQWDWPMPDTPLPCWEFSNTDTLHPHLFEAWTELYAEWLWCGWHNHSWVKQREWQLTQALQVLARASHTWKEDTNIFAYYVLKACLAPHIEFLWSSRNGTTKAEFSYILCTLVTPTLNHLKDLAKSVVPIDIRMRMSQKIDS